ncbi:ABC transporter permease [Membranihabitans maritimus]|uniref:ABC transporter permease n=1 Tax=Membranihabitans maritimus TaxID=2904244 RepID=UPI001F43AD6A|nr:ABC transporter permease [Membranihabitans maritimus]
MIKHYIKIAWRNLSTNKFYSLINIGGLAIGLATCLMILLYVFKELSYDKHFKNHDQIYRLVLEKEVNGEWTRELYFPTGLPYALKSEFPEIKSATRINSFGLKYFKIQGEYVKLDQLRVDKSFFEIFSISLIRGNTDESASGMIMAVISRHIAELYFPDEDPIGQIIYQKPAPWPTPPLKVTGIIENIPSNTHFKADIIEFSEENEFSFDAWPQNGGTRMFHQYIELTKNTRWEDISRKMPSIYKKYNFPKEIRLSFQPVTDIHLYSDFPQDLEPGGDIRYIYIFSIVAILLLLIAGINYINLTTAKSMKRSREAGICKTIGASRSQLLTQFIGESLFFVFFALLIALLMVPMAIPFFNSLYDKSIVFHSLFQPGVITGIGLLLTVLVLSSCLYPALFLSSQKPTRVLKGILPSSPFNFNLRKILVIVQFSISGALIACTFIIFWQISYISNKKLGYNKEQVLMIRPNNMREQGKSFKQELLRHPGIMKAGTSSWSPENPYSSYTTVSDPKETGKEFRFSFNEVDPDFMPALDMELVKGRFFSEEFPADFQGIDFGSNRIEFSDENMALQKTRSIILNETAINALNLQKPYINQVLSHKGLSGKIIGVIKDFNTVSLHQKVPPMAFYAWKNPNRATVYLRLVPQNIKEALSYIEIKWKKFFPNQPFEFSFLDETLDQLYVSEKRLVRLFGIFAILAIGISCLGLFALAAFTAEQRTKEIGIRKVLGASVANVVALLSKDFIRLVLIAIVIATPIAWYAMNLWLQGFAYRIELQWWMFVGAGLVAVVIAMVTVSGQSVRAAMADPVASLHSE